MSKTEILVLWLLNLLAAVGAALWLRHVNGVNTEGLSVPHPLLRQGRLAAGG